MSQMIDSWSASKIAARVATRKSSAREVTETVLRRIDETEPEVNAFIHVAHDDALAQADAIDKALGAGETPGPLAGVPVSVKDLVHVAGMPTTYGSRAFQGAIAAEDAVPVARLRAAGAIIVGKTTTSEFGHKPVTEGPFFGKTLNPWNHKYSSGGSSGGAAASVAAGQTPLAVGTDGGGSVRIPASVCGVYGLKTTLGVVPHIHAPDLFANGSFIGPMARDINDLWLMYDVMRGPDSRDPWSKAFTLLEADSELSKLRVGYALTVGNPGVEPEVARSFVEVVNGLEEIGVTLRQVKLDFYRWEPKFRALLQTGFAARSKARVDSDPQLFDPSFVRTVELASAYSAVDVQNALQARTTLYREIEALFNDIDVLVTPTLAAPSVLAGTDSHADVTIAGVNAGPIRAGWYPYTWPFNLTGHPALSMPCAWTTERLPVGVQIAGPWYSEARLLSVSSALRLVMNVSPRVWSLGTGRTGPN